MQPSQPVVPPPTPLPATVQQHLFMSLEHLATSIRQLQQLPSTPAFRGLIRAILNGAALQYIELASHQHSMANFAASLRSCRCALHVFSLQDLQPTTATPAPSPTSENSAVVIYGTSVSFKHDARAMTRTLELIADNFSVLSTVANFDSVQFNAELGRLGEDEATFIAAANATYIIYVDTPTFDVDDPVV